MVRVELCRPVATVEDVEVVAHLVVHGSQVEQLDGPLAHLIDLSAPVLGITEGRIVRFHEDPEEWARSLPGAFRAPDLFARVTADDHPVDSSQAEPVRIKVPALN